MIPLFEVQARWAYSEILSVNAGSWYDNGHEIQALRSKRSAAISFSSLSENEKYNLAFTCASVRTNLMVFFTGIEGFDLTQLTRADLRNLIVPSNVSGLPGICTFDTYIVTPTSAPGDARNVRGTATTYQPPTDPLTIGHCYQYRVLVDGYHRAAAFWKYGPITGSIEGYAPHTPARGRIG
jgi:hypothetical protein